LSVHVTMPKLGLTMKEGKVSKWYKSEGDAVEQGQDLFEVETEKITNRVEAPSGGTLFQIVVPAGTTVPVGTVLAVIAEAGEQPERVEGMPISGEPPAPAAAPEKAPAASAPAGEARVSSTPAARRLAKELGVDLSRVAGSGPGGKIKESDVQKFHDEGPPLPKITPLALEMARKEGLDVSKIQGTGEGGKITREDVRRALEGPPAQAPSAEEPEEGGVKVVPMAGMRKAIADNMHASLQNAAQLTAFTEVDVTEMVRFRDVVREQYKGDESVKVSYNDIIILAAAKTLKRHPVMNSTLEGDRILLHDAVHMGIAVALDEGLIVPKLRNAHRKGLLEIAREARELARKARQGQLSMDEVTGGTFTITNVSMLDMDGFTPVLNPPETAILGVGRVQAKPAVFQGDIAIRQMTTLSLTFDHRVADGAPAMAFLRDLARCLKEPLLLLT